MPLHDLVFWSVDVQADFMLPGGALYVPGAEQRIPNIQRLISAALAAGVSVVSSADAHTPQDPEFEHFRPHCVAQTSGAGILPQALGPTAWIVQNGAGQTLPEDILDWPQVIVEKQSLDVFDNPRTVQLVARLGPSVRYVVFGVVTEFCVRRAALGLLRAGRSVSLVTDAIQPLDAAAGRQAIEELLSLGVALVTTDGALAMIGLSKS